MGFVYIMTNKPFGVLYIGVTNHLLRRVIEHKTKLHDGFTKKYNLTRLVYYEYSESIYSAIEREKRLKHLLRREKIELITASNPMWKDLFSAIKEFDWD